MKRLVKLMDRKGRTVGFEDVGNFGVEELTRFLEIQEDLGRRFEFVTPQEEQLEINRLKLLQECGSLLQ